MQTRAENETAGYVVICRFIKSKFAWRAVISRSPAAENLWLGTRPIEHQNDSQIKTSKPNRDVGFRETIQHARMMFGSLYVNRRYWSGIPRTFTDSYTIAIACPLEIKKLGGNYEDAVCQLAIWYAAALEKIRSTRANRQGTNGHVAWKVVGGPICDSYAQKLMRVKTVFGP
ncbi:uncharacterized protein BP5553_06880 [Venustampulla echinocandica]|uniref:Uncharacterized protein n=1 Tax=Venustampulla echinocandica TaxID=2656787 RepID=A0A370TL65_9HELO|nr:uncharacterized protein BP5553_06880 [Venustampulla echinocandica]RDL36268.1 hypothetical protein BP5553_06880 [Venustampulla echinocandica]